MKIAKIFALTALVAGQENTNLGADLDAERGKNKNNRIVKDMPETRVRKSKISNLRVR